MRNEARSQIDDVELDMNISNRRMFRNKNMLLKPLARLFVKRRFADRKAAIIEYLFPRAFEPNISYLHPAPLSRNAARHQCYRHRS